MAAALAPLLPAQHAADLRAAAERVSVEADVASFAATHAPTLAAPPPLLSLPPLCEQLAAPPKPEANAAADKARRAHPVCTPRPPSPS